MTTKLSHQHYDVLIALLKSAGLPTEDIDLKKQQFYGLFQQENLIGAAALEIYGSNALLRSVVLQSNYRQLGHGKRLISEVEQEATKSGITNLYLLTKTAQGFFAQLGYKTTERDLVPVEILESNEFTKLCPANAICMVLHLN